MADYYPLLAKAMANLPNRSTSSARRAIYERARKALIGQLRSIQPPMLEADIVSEDAALDQAIARLEAEYGGQPPPASGAPPPASAPKAAPTPPPPSAVVAGPKPTPATAPPLARPISPPPRPAPASIPRPPPAAGAAPSTIPPAAAGAPLRTAPAATPPAAVGTPPRASSIAAPSPLPRPLTATPSPRAPISAAPSPLAPPPIAAPTARAAPSIEAARPLSGAISAASIAPPVAAQPVSSAAENDAAPPVAAASPPPGQATSPGRPGSTIARPSAPGRIEEPRSRPWQLVGLILLIGVAGVLAATGYLMRDRPIDVAVKAGTETADQTKQAAQSKIAERIKGAGQSDPQPAAGETPIPTVTVPVAPVQVAPGAGAAAGAMRMADNVQNAAGPQAQAPTTQAPPSGAPPGSSRAAMLIGVASDPQKPVVYLGDAIWSIIPGNPGQPATLAVRIEINIPDQKMHASVTIRKNTDPSLPATHTIDLRAAFADGAEIKGLKDMGLPQLRKDDSPNGDAVSGVRVKINDTYYLVGLTRSDTDAAHNLDLLATKAWFDFPLLLNDDRIAKLTFTKGETGDRVMAQALDAWK